ncbi:MAG: LPXTG cell wall anchor domain-containing protein [Planctomycetes bacterium]|nr:LPXTG cell wall anchor domain-containing protein [Planctomycetota bacterium]
MPLQEITTPEAFALAALGLLGLGVLGGRRRKRT